MLAVNRNSNISEIESHSDVKQRMTASTVSKMVFGGSPRGKEIGSSLYHGQKAKNSLLERAGRANG